MIPHVNAIKYIYKSDKALVREINSEIDTLNKNDDNDPSGIRDIIDKAKKRKAESDLVKEMESRLQEIELQNRKRRDAEREYIPNPPKLVLPSPPSFPQKKRFACNICHTFKAVKEYSEFRNPHDLYYITHFDNIPSIIENGIFSRNLLAEQNIHPTDIGDQSVLETRKCKACNDKNLWSYANVYFEPRNAMLYRIKNTYGWKTGILKVELDLNSPDLWITDGNAANNVTEFFPSDRRDEILPKIQKETIGVRWFNTTKEVERKVQAECIVLKQINPNCIKSIHVSKNSNFINEWKRLVKDSGLPVIPEGYMFFE